MITHSELLSLLRYEPETGRFFWRKKCGARALPGNEAGCLNMNGYTKIKIRRVEYQRSRLAWLYVHGEWPPLFIDHINRNRSDDRIINLRIATRTQNNCNTKIRSDNTTGTKGVVRHNGKFMARINFQGKSIYLGIHKTIDAAADAVRDASIKYHKDFSSHP